MYYIDKPSIISALVALGDRAADLGLHIELLVVGGAAMVLLFDARNSTKDVDVKILAPENAAFVRELAAEIGLTHNLPENWLNDAAKGFLHGITKGSTVLTSRGIDVVCPLLAQLLAMKLRAWRDEVDISDAKRILEDMTGTKESVWEQVKQFLSPGSELKAQYAFEDLWIATHGDH